MNKKVYLTFDDGPKDFSKDILEVLKKYNAKATFFMLEPLIRTYADNVRAMVEDGHVVGLHGVTHQKEIIYSSVDAFLNEMDTTRATLKEITGVDSNLIRAPYGTVPNLTRDEANIIEAHGYQMWDWNVDSRDWYFRDMRYVDSVIEQVNKLTNKEKPIVILVHERKETLEFLPHLLDYLVENKFEFDVLNTIMTPVQLLK